MAAAPGGGGMAQSQAKYDQYRNIIDERLYGIKFAAVDLSVQRTGNTIQIAAAAKADLAELTKLNDKAPVKSKKPADKDNDPDQKGEPETKKQDEEPKLKLYLAVTEGVVRYVGSNRIRFHHHLVRAIVGGKEGEPLSNGVAETKVTLDVNDIRQELTGYLDEYQKTGSFPNPLPPIDLKGLSVVAFVQDDTSKQILHATVVDLPDRN